MMCHHTELTLSIADVKLEVVTANFAVHKSTQTTDQTSVSTAAVI
jgi:hypothetical protein